MAIGEFYSVGIKNPSTCDKRTHTNMMMSSNTPPKRGLPATHPGEILREDVFPALGLTIKEIAEALGVSRQHLYSILNERERVTAEMAMRLGKLLGNGPNVWLNMQARWDIEHLQKTMAAELDDIPQLKAMA
jgi:antitoxin HigA-1